MKKEKRADAILTASTRWQNGHGDSAYFVAREFWFRDIDPIVALVEPSTSPAPLGLWASAALSEVCHGLGFELEDDEP